MKPETLIYEKLIPVVPNNSEKTVFFFAVTDTRYEAFFYAFIDGKPAQCFALAEQGALDANDLDRAFRAAVGIIRDSRFFEKDRCNVFTYIISRAGIHMQKESYEKGMRMYEVKEGWKRAVTGGEAARP